MIVLRLAPMDTWQFGLGVPSQAESASQLPRQTAMPSSPTTVAGALRAALARAQGWGGRGSWAGNPGLVQLVGDGPDNYGATTFCGPLLAEGDQLLVPVPATARLQEKRLVAPVVLGEPALCDLGPQVPLATIAADGAAPPEDGLVAVEEARALLAGEPIEEGCLVCVGDLWALEHRTGIARNRATRTVAEGALFDVVHVRPRPGRDPALVVVASGDEGCWGPVRGLVPLGGEGRLAWLERWKPPLPWFGLRREDLQRILDERRAALLVVTPMQLSPDAWRGTAPLPGLEPGKIRGAVGPRPIRLGGWDGRKSVPTPQRSCIAPGTVLFVEAPDGEHLAESLTRLGPIPQLGERRAAGFGLVLVAPTPVDGAGSGASPRGEQHRIASLS